MPGKALKFQDGTATVSWNSESVSTDTIDGVTRSLPCEPHPLGFEAPSGLSRVAQLSAAQAVGMPFLLAYCMNQDGLVADRIVMHRGDNCNWHSTVLRLRMSSFLDKTQRQTLPQRSLGISARARAAFPHQDQGSTHAKAPVTLNAAADIISLDRMGFLSYNNFTPSHLPSSTVVLRKNMQAGQRMVVAAHVNRQFSHATGWRQVPLVFNADWVANPRSAPCTLRAGVSHVSTDTNDDATWTFPTLSHHLCLHSAAVLTASFSSRPPGGNATAEDEAQGSGEALDLEQLRGAEAPSDLVSVRVKLPDGTIENLGKHQPHITIAHKDMRPSLASISSLGKSDDGGSQAPCSSSAAMHQSEGPLSHAHTSAATAACCGGSSSSKSPDSQPAEVHRPLGGLLHLDKDSFEHVVHDLQDKVTEVSTLLKGTTASGVLHKLRSSEKTLKETRGKVQDAQKKVKDGRWQKALRGGPSKWLARRSVPWLWNVSPGASASVQLGAAGRLPVDSQEVVRLLLGRGEGPRPGVSSQNGSLWGSLFAPLAHRLCMQPLLRARLEGTVGKFRSITGDHTSAVLELETCSRAVGAARAGPELLQSQQPPGLRHVVSLSAKQQIVGPVRACVDLRWEVGSSAQSAGDDVARGGPSLGRIQRYCQGLTARHTGLNVGVDASFGVVRAAAWYSMHHRQGMVELRV